MKWFLSFVLLSCGVTAMNMGGTLEDFLVELEHAGYISSAQSEAVTHHYLLDQDLTYKGHQAVLGESLESNLANYLTQQVDYGTMSSDTAYYLSTLLNIHTETVTGSSRSSSSTPVPKNYGGNGNVVRLGGQIAPDPVNMATRKHYNGIWGYAVGSREYALQCNQRGLHIIDITDPANAYRVQLIEMAGGEIWRDVETQQVGGTTYAYVAAQRDGNLWVVNLSSLSGGDAHSQDSNPIPSSAYADLGRTNYGHTLTVYDGLLFLNTAGVSSLGCQIFDIYANPMNPPLINDYSGSQRDCHDSMIADVPGHGRLLFSSDGYTGRSRIIDIDNIRSNGNLPSQVEGDTGQLANSYAHSSTLSTDKKYLFTCEERNNYDLTVYNVENPASPSLVTSFRYWEDDVANSPVHNARIYGNYLLVAYYKAGFRVFDVSNPSNVIYEVGKYETWRDPDGDGNYNNQITPGGNGAWNLHIMASGKILVSDMSHGTFVFQVNDVPVPSAPANLSGSGDTNQVTLQWTASAGSTGYTVYRGGTEIASNLANTAYTDTDVPDVAEVTYEVSATNAGGESTKSTVSVSVGGEEIPEEVIINNGFSKNDGPCSSLGSYQECKSGTNCMWVNNMMCVGSG